MEYITVAGYIGQAKVLEANGKKRQQFSLAVNWKRKNEEGTRWYDVFAYHNPNLEQYLVAGTFVVVAGRFEAAINESQRTGKVYLNLTVNADYIHLGPKSAKAEGGSAPAAAAQPTAPARTAPAQADDDDDGIPF